MLKTNADLIAALSDLPAGTPALDALHIVMTHLVAEHRADAIRRVVEIMWGKPTPVIRVIKHEA